MELQERKEPALKEWQSSKNIPYTSIVKPKQTDYKGEIEFGYIFRLNKQFKSRIVLINQIVHSLIGDKRTVVLFDLNTNERFSCAEDNFRKCIDKKIKFKQI